ncbi:MAG: hypothetical protein QM770_03665 [Tepidisphaeraceae bacterium]
MREVDFLPDWYPRVRWQQVLLKIEVSIVVTLVLVVSAYLVWMRQRVTTAESAFRVVSSEQAETRRQVKELDQTMQLQAELLSKQRLVAELGMPIELTRVISEIGECMPSEMTLNEFECTTDQRPMGIEEKALRGIRDEPGAGPRVAMTRTLQVAMRGVAPTESQVARFYGDLAERRFFDGVRLNSEETKSNDHVMRNFETSFTVPLDYMMTK